jgi:hypothetical protein
MGLACVLWDFGDTLVDERWMQQAPRGVPEWPRVWSEVAGGELADQWNLGEVSLADIVEAVAARLPMTSEAVLDHVRWCCANIRFFDLPLQVARDSSLYQAIVTVNPDGFSELVEPTYRLGEVFRPIVTSWQEHTLDKAALGLLALERLGGRLRPPHALLVDNRSENIEAWEELGGRGYLFRGEREFRSDLGGQLRELAESAGWAAA